MQFSLSTRWNAYRHKTGESLVDEILELGFDRIELGYDLRIDLVAGVKSRIESGDICAPSVHNYSPVPVAAPRGHPELFSLSSLDRRERESAVRYTGATIEFAAEVGAKAVVVHAGNVGMRKRSSKLIDLIENGKQHTKKFEKIKMKLLLERDKKVTKHLDQLYRSLEALLPQLEKHSIRMGLENLPSWEAIPTESEAQTIFNKFNSPFLGYWHDMGHGQIRHNLGLTSHKLWFDKLSQHLVGMHIHDTIHPAGDHVMPPQGGINFTDFSNAPDYTDILVFEPCPGTPPEYVQKGLEHVKTAWRKI
jgi:sugar phosphate isomerase/epimerase